MLDLLLQTPNLRLIDTETPKEHPKREFHALQTPLEPFILAHQAGLTVIAVVAGNITGVGV